MAWQDELIPLVRILIDDNNPSSYTYSDITLEQLIVAAARYVCSQVDLANVYTLNVANSTISPDPTTGTEDTGFITLVCLKTACLVVNAEVKVAANRSYVIKDGPSTIDTRTNYQSISELAKRLSDDYENMKMQYQAGNSRAGHAILSTYVTNEAIPIWGNLS